jgi:hypothetical protein
MIIPITNAIISIVEQSFYCQAFYEMSPNKPGLALLYQSLDSSSKIPNSSRARAISAGVGPDFRQFGKTGGIPGRHFFGIERYFSGIGFITTLIFAPFL